MIQQFRRGDRVRVEHELHPGEAIVIGSYNDQYASGSRECYTLLFCSDGNQVSWFEPQQMTFLSHAGEAAIEELDEQRRKAVAQQSQLEWIIAHWPDITGASFEALAKACNLPSCWGAEGEGISFYANALTLKRLLDTAMRAGIEAARSKIAEIGAAPGAIPWHNHLFAP